MPNIYPAYQSFDEAVALPCPADMTLNSAECGWHRGAGYLVHATKPLVGQDGAAHTNLFQVTGSIELLGLWGVFTDVTDVTAITAASFNLFDGTDSVQITKNQGVLSGVALGTIFAKERVNTENFTVNDAALASYSESTHKRVFHGGLLTQKSGANTFIRFSHTTGAVEDYEIQFFASWVCRSPNSKAEAV